jgi:hypothetical protein
MTDFNFDQANYSDLLAEAKRLDNRLRITQSALNNRERQFQLAKGTFTELLEVNPDLFGDEDLLTEIMNEFDIEILQTVNFTITVELTGTMEIRRGTDPDLYSFDVPEVYYDGEPVSLSDCSLSDLNYDVE